MNILTNVKKLQDTDIETWKPTEEVPLHPIILKMIRTVLTSKCLSIEEMVYSNGSKVGNLSRCSLCDQKKDDQDNSDF